MKKWSKRSLLVIFSIPGILNGQTTSNSKQQFSYNQPKITSGVQLLTVMGPWPSTALSSSGSTSDLKDQHNSVKSFGLGLLLKYRVSSQFHLVLDATLYNYAIRLGTKGSSIQSSWTLNEGAKHWDESNAPQTLQVNNLPGDVYFDMFSGGLRLSGRYYLTNKRINPWIGAGLGYYGWQVNYCDETNINSYGADHGNSMGITYSAGFDLHFIKGMTNSVFVECGSPIANYQISGLFYKQWNISSEAPLLGSYRIGTAVLF